MSRALQVVGLCLALLVSAGLSWSVWDESAPRAGGALDLVDPDGVVGWFTGGTAPAEHGPQVIETVHTSGHRPFVSSHWSFREAVNNDEAQTAGKHWVVERLGPERRADETLFSITADGIAEVAHATREGSTWHRPARTLVPADPEVGMTWQQQGSFATAETENGTWQATGEVRAGSSPQCLVFVIDETRSDGTTQRVEQERCRGVGLVRDVVRGLTRTATRPGAAPEFTTKNQTQQATEWAPRQLPMTVFGRRTGAVPTTDTVVANQVIVSSDGATDEVMTSVIAEGEVRSLWRRHPGGEVMNVMAAGQMVVSATSRSELVAYRIDGRLLWRQPSADVVDCLVRVGNDRLLTLSPTGQVAMHELTTGRELWSRSFPASSSPFVHATESEVVLGVGSTVRVLNTGDGSTRWERTVPLGVDAVASSQQTVTVVQYGGSVLAFDLASAELRWSYNFETVVYGATVLPDGRVVVLGDDRLFGLEPGAGRESFRVAVTQAQSLHLIDVGGEPGLVVLHGNDLVSVFDQTGELRHQGSGLTRSLPLGVSGAIRPASPLALADLDSRLWLWGAP